MMRPPGITEILERLNSREGTFLIGPQPPERIARAQVAMGVEFPPSYLEFISLCGCGGIGGQRLYGVLKDDFSVPGVPDAIWLTLNERERGLIPSELIVIGAVGDGALYVLDTSQRDTDGEAPVLEWWPGLPLEKQDREGIWPSFGHYLLYLVEEANEFEN